VVRKEGSEAKIKGCDFLTRAVALAGINIVAMSRFRTVFLFDLDGTLLDSVYQHVLAWKEALDEEGMICRSGASTEGLA
jgi:hypothetical protein